MTEKRCRGCGAALSRYNSESLCWPCQAKSSGDMTTERPYYDLEDMQRMLGLESAESVKRLGRDGVIPGRIPGIKAHRYLKDVVDEWVRSGGDISHYDARATIHSTVVVPAETHETTLTDNPVTCHHSLGAVPQNVLITVTDKGVPGPPPMLGDVTASSYMLTSLVTSGQIVKHTAILTTPWPPIDPSQV